MANSPKKSIPTAVTAVKGHLVTKSSALAATGSCKLESQFITAQNMASHYKRVINAKSSIDTLPPKSIIKSQKARDRAKREMISLNKSVDRAKSADSLRNSISNTDNDFLMKTTPRVVKSARGPTKEEEIKPRQLPDRDKLNRSMSNLMSQFTSHSKQRVSTYKPPTPNHFDSHTDKPMTSRSVQSRTSLEDKTRNALSTLLLNSQQDPNQPRLVHPALKAMSRLIGNHNYDVLDNHADKFKAPTKEFVPRIKNTNSQSNLSKNNSCYQAPRRRRRNKTIPNEGNPMTSESKVSFRENETIEDDFENEESEIAKVVVQKNRSKLNTSNFREDEDNDDENEFQTSFNRIKKEDSDVKQAVDKEDQLKYLQFVKEVTNDILARGISSNRVIKNCFESHIRKNRDQLNEAKMRELLNTLKKDIGIKDEPEEYEENMDGNVSYHQTINKALNLDKKLRENKLDQTNTSVGSEYLTLKKFGYSNSDAKQDNASSFTTSKPNTSLKSQEILVSNIESRSRNSSRRNSVKSQENINRSYRNLQEMSRSNSNENINSKSSPNQTNQNINENKENSNPVSEVLVRKQSSGSRKSSNSSLGSTNSKASILKKTRSLSQQSTLEEANTVKKNDSDDDDVFAGGYEPPTNKAPVKRTQIVRSENSDDIKFDDDYGSVEEDDDDKDDDFNNLLKTKTLKNRKKSSESNASLDIGESASLNMSTANKGSKGGGGPTPQPRKTTTNSKTNSKDDDDENSDDDEF